MNIFDEYLPKEEYLHPAWYGCLSWAIGKDDVVKRFREETGNQWQPARGGIEAMIDKATGVDVDFLKSFAKWMNENIWGEGL